MRADEMRAVDDPFEGSPSSSSNSAAAILPRRGGWRFSLLVARPQVLHSVYGRWLNVPLRLATKSKNFLPH